METEPSKGNSHDVRLPRRIPAFSVKADTKMEPANLREFAKNSRAFKGFRVRGNCVDLIFSLVDQLLKTPLAFDMRMPPPMKGISTS